MYPDSNAHTLNVQRVQSDPICIACFETIGDSSSRLELQHHKELHVPPLSAFVGSNERKRDMF